MVSKHRGDPVVRAVTILISKRLKGLLGKRLDRTAAKLASVALGATTSSRVARSKLSRKKSPKKQIGKKTKRP
jgi:hypothetical protein